MSQIITNPSSFFSYGIWECLKQEFHGSILAETSRSGLQIVSMPQMSVTAWWKRSPSFLDCCMPSRAA